MWRCKEQKLGVKVCNLDVIERRKFEVFSEVIYISGQTNEKKSRRRAGVRKKISD